MRTAFCRQCAATATAENYSDAHSMIVAHNRAVHMDIETIQEQTVKDGYIGAMNALTAVERRLGLRGKALMSFLKENGFEPLAIEIEAAKFRRKTHRKW